ncbi:hypothetical protein NM208_g16717 [Fusarium decemcellulare]|uniref:Uncharacterized protein n=1 Tax=Fusarium decemcellulare TaxID=57161 RepID=A0ACC1RDK0_9HYPO|nr:hypothetical protein NM208_g16717 [Fusarium decemcellulare]
MNELPVTTLVPFNNRKILPACAASCGAFYDANAACVPPQVIDGDPTDYTKCFCVDTRVDALSTARTGVCDDVCNGKELSSITAWFRDFCAIGETSIERTPVSTTIDDAASTSGSKTTSNIIASTTGSQAVSNSAGGNGDLSTGAKAGIAIGATACATLIAALLVWIFMIRKHRLRMEVSRAERRAAEQSFTKPELEGTPVQPNQQHQAVHADQRPNLISTESCEIHELPANQN